MLTFDYRGFGRSAGTPSESGLIVDVWLGKRLRWDRLGTGSFGRVHLVRSKHNGRFYAIKVLNKEKVVRMKQVEHTNSEREMLVRVRHPFLVNLWGTFHDVNNLYMVMDFVAGGELFSLLRKSQVSRVELGTRLIPLSPS